MTTTIERAPQAGRRFRHEALFYQGLDGFISGTVPFIRDAIDADEPVLVVVAGHKIDALRDELGYDADRVDFADMRSVGANPARIIPAWYDFVAERTAGGRHIRGIGEPISPDRSPEALVECQRHESLLNLAFADASAWWLMCPYDTNALDHSVVEEALRSHPYVLENGTHRSSASYSDLPNFAKPFDLPLPDPRGPVHSLSFDLRRLEDVRCLVAGFAAAQGLGQDRVDDLMLAVNEVATNSLCHGGGQGDLRLWREADRITCEVSDAGLIDMPLVGRRRPDPEQDGGFGIWLVHQLCDLVQLRTFPEGTVVRMHMTLPNPGIRS